MLKSAIKKLVGLVLVIAVSGYTILGFFQLYNKIDTSIIVNRITSSSYLAETVIEKICSAKSVAGDKQIPVNKKESNNTASILFYIFSICFISQNKILILCLIALTIIIMSKKKIIGQYKSPFKKSSDITFYKKWILKFLTPIQKCMFNRADEYDINPIKVWVMK